MNTGVFLYIDYIDITPVTGLKTLKKNKFGRNRNYKAGQLA